MVFCERMVSNTTDPLSLRLSAQGKLLRLSAQGKLLRLSAQGRPVGEGELDAGIALHRHVRLFIVRALQRIDATCKRRRMKDVELGGVEEKRRRRRRIKGVVRRRQMGAVRRKASKEASTERRISPICMVVAVYRGTALTGDFLCEFGS